MVGGKITLIHPMNRLIIYVPLLHSFKYFPFSLGISKTLLYDLGRNANIVIMELSGRYE